MRRAAARSRKSDTGTLPLFTDTEVSVAESTAVERSAPEIRDVAKSWLAEAFAEHVVRWAERLGAAPSTLQVVRSAACAVSMATASGHACIDIRTLPDLEGDPKALRDVLLASNVIDGADAPRGAPLVLDRDGRLYLHRYFDYERRIAARLMRTGQRLLDHAQEQRLAARLNALFTANAGVSDSSVDPQKLAAALAVLNGVTVISGGPGTGKTTTVVNLLACLIELEPDCRIALAAPTGKAAARMQDAVRHRAAQLPEHVQHRLPSESFTIHRLLGVTPAESEFVHHAGNPLPYDVVVIDEASMLDLALAAKLFDAVPESARIILLGDKDQLAAVESGAVFSELSADPTLSDACITRLARLCGVPAARIVTPAAVTPTPLHDRVVWFTHNFRFAADSGIGRIAREINSGDAKRSIACLRSDRSVSWIDDAARTLCPEALARVNEGYAPYIAALRTDARNQNAVFDAFDRFRVLCAERAGMRGVRVLNDVIGKLCRDATEAEWPTPGRSVWYAGRPVMVLRNDYVLKLYNGDIGIALPDHDGNLTVQFRQADGSLRNVSPMRLPEHETAFATTVHKAQGSEFDEVALVLPAKVSPVVTRELVYTAVTRARTLVTLIAGAEVLASAIETPTLRHSGLIARLADAANLASTGLSKSDG